MAVKRVVIVGGGIAGLAAAYRLASHSGLTATPTASLQAQAQERREGPGVGGEVAVSLIEGEARLGGKIVTEHVDGFVIEGGPDSFLSTKPHALDLCRELGLAARLRGTNEKARRTYVMRGGRLYDLPEGLTGLIPTRLGPLLKTPLLSPLGKLRLGLDYLIPPLSADGDESLAAFVERRLGREAYDRLIEPLMSGIYAGDGRHLSLRATFPQLRQAELEHGGLIKGVLAAQPSASTPRRPSAFLAPAAGLAEMVEALEAHLGGVEIRLGTRATRVDSDSPGCAVTLETGERLQAEAVILATPAFITADLVGDLDPKLGAALRGIPYVSTATVSVAYPIQSVPRPLDGYGYIIPRAEGRPVLACTWTSTKFPGRAPEGFALLRAFIGRAGQEDVFEATDDELLGLVRDELRATLGLTAPPTLYRLFRWPEAMPQYTLGHLERLAVIEKRLAAQPGLFVAGSAYRGIGLPDCIASGERSAAQVLAFLQTSPEHLAS